MVDDNKIEIWQQAMGSVLCITTNGDLKRDGALVMGKGIALAAKKKFKGIDYIAGDFILNRGNNVYYLGEHKNTEHSYGATYHIVTFPTKHHWAAPSDINLIIESAKQLVELTDLNGWPKVYLPRPGCSNGGLDWADVKSAIKDILDDRFTVCNGYIRTHIAC